MLMGVGNGNPLQYSCLENSMDGGAWQATVHVVPKSRIGQSNFTFTFMHWRRKWQLTPLFLPGESQGRGSLVGCRLWGRTGSDTTEVIQQQQQQQQYANGLPRWLSGKLPAMQETPDIWVQFLDWKDPLEEGMASHSRILAWRIPWTEELDRIQSIHKSQTAGHD